MTDVEKWPEWTPSISKIERIGSGPFGVGSSARIVARGTPASVWQVTEFEENRSFTWEAKTANSLAVAGHVIEPEGEGSKVKLAATIGGLFVTLLGPMIGMTAPERASGGGRAEAPERGGGSRNLTRGFRGA